MQTHPFVNHYESLGVEATATTQDIERTFRQLARRYHPDNQATGDREKFDAVLEAHRTLSVAGLRAQYHADNFDRLPPLSVATISPTVVVSNDSVITGSPSEHQRIDAARTAV